MELWSCSSWKCPLRSWSPAVPPALLRPPLTYVPKFHIRTVFKSLQGWELYPGQPVQGLDMDSLSTKKFLPISYLNLPWHNLRLFLLVLSLVCWEQSLTPPFSLGIVGTEKVPLSLLFSGCASPFPGQDLCACSTES